MATRDFLKELNELDAQVDGSLDDLITKIEKAVDRNSTGDQITNEDRLMKEINPVLLAFIVSVMKGIERSNIRLAKIRADEELEKVLKLFTRVKSRNKSQVIKNFRNEVKNYPQDIKKRLWTRKPFIDGRNAEYRFKTVYSSSQKTVRNLIQLNLNSKDGATRLKEKLKVYVKPSVNAKGKKAVAPKDVYRKRFGLDAKDPVKIRGGSVEYNAMRIARTETQRTYRAAPEELHRGKPWVAGFKWNLSGRHKIMVAANPKKKDICDQWAEANKYKLGEGVYPAGKVPKGHPNDRCVVTTVLVPPEKLQQILDRM